jgi:hypothetical protein
MSSSSPELRRTSHTRHSGACERTAAHQPLHQRIESSSLSITRSETVRRMRCRLAVDDVSSYADSRDADQRTLLF